MKGWLFADLLNPFRNATREDFDTWRERLQAERDADWPDQFRNACVSLAEALGEAADRTDELFR